MDSAPKWAWPWSRKNTAQAHLNSLEARRKELAVEREQLLADYDRWFEALTTADTRLKQIDVEYSELWRHVQVVSGLDDYHV